MARIYETKLCALCVATVMICAPKVANKNRCEYHILKWSLYYYEIMHTVLSDSFRVGIFIFFEIVLIVWLFMSVQPAAICTGFFKITSL